MKFWRYLWMLLALLVISSCGSYEEQKRVETALEQSVNRFHEELNNEQFHDIYSQADAKLQKGIDETEFTVQLKSAHDQLGRISGKAIVLLTSRAWSALSWARTFGREQNVSDVVTPNSELVNATERFGWKIENDQPKLTSYEFRFICRRPCTVGIGPS